MITTRMEKELNAQIKAEYESTCISRHGGLGSQERVFRNGEFHVEAGKEEEEHAMNLLGT